LNNKTKNYLVKVFDKKYPKYEKLINKAIENKFVLRKNTNFKAVEAAFEAIYEKHIIRTEQEPTFYSSKYSVSKQTFGRYFKKLEKLLSDYLSQLDEFIDNYICLFDYAMKILEISSEKDFVKIEDFFNATFNYVESFGQINREEAKHFFCSYFYLLDFEAKKGRITSNSYKLYITPNKTNLFLNIKIRRGNACE
jgi:hypothetical protein